MRPILYSKNETRFDTYGLGEIDALKGNATRERNGNYSAYLEYPASGPLASVFEKEMKFKADAGTRTKNQTFEIVRVVKDSSSTIKIYAQHISHKLEYMSVRHGIKVSGTADLALKTWAKNLIGDYHFDTWSDIDTVLPITFLVDKMENARLALGGVEGSILDIWGGEYEFDNQTVRLHKRLGRRAPTVLEYGRNILSAESDESIESAYTSVVPFATYTPESQEGDSRQQDPVLVTIPESYVDSKYVSMYANRRIKVVDFSGEFKDESTGESKKKDIPTPEKLKALAIKYMENNRIGAPKINTKIEYVDLAQTLDYAERGWIEELELCDIVPVYYPEIGITEDDAKVTKVVYDFLNDRNESVEFGMIGESIRSAMTGGLAGRLDDLEKSQQSLENRQSKMAFELPKYLLDAKGNRVWNETPDENIEHKVGDIWFEKNGLYQRLYIWNGEMWEKRIDTEDVSKVGEKFDAEVKKINQSMATQNQQTNEALRMAGANASAIEAAKGAITKLNQDLAGAKQTNQATIDRLKSDFASAQKVANDQTALLKSDLANIRTQQTVYEQTNSQNMSRIVGQIDDKASKSEVNQTADRIREEIASLSVGENLFINSEFKNLRDSGQRYTANGKTYQNMIAPYWYNPYNAGLPNAQNIQHGYFDTETSSETVFAFNESDGSRHWKALSTDFKIGVITSGEYYFSADLYATDLGTHIKFGFYYHNSTGKLNFYAGQTKIEVTEKGRWVRLGAPLKVNDDIDLTKKVQFYIYGYNFASNSILYLKKPKVSKGRLKSDWSPALEDVDGLITEAKSTFERTAQGLRTDLSAIQSYVNADGARAEALQTYSREETARQLTAERKLIEAGYVGKAQHTEDVRSISRRFEELAVGGRNLMGVFNTKPVKSTFEPDTYRFTAKTTQNTTRPTLMLQFRWTDGSYSAVITISETGQFARKFKITKPYSELRVKFNCNKEDAVLLFTGRPFIEQNTDYYFTGDLINLSPNDSQADFLKIEKATITSDWSPAPEDAKNYADTKLAEYKQDINGQLASVQAALNTANGSLTNFNNWKQSAQETLNKVGRVETGLNENKASLAEFKRTAEGQLTTITQQVAGKANQTEFQRIQETSKLYERLIGSTEKEVTDKVSRMALTNELFQVEVSKNLGLRTVQYQIANAWAVQNLDSNGDIVSQINATGPNVRIQGESIHLDGKALIDNGIIKNAMIESMLADKITAGTLNAANVNIINLNANKIVGLDANFIKSKIELALVDWLKGKVITAQNDAMKIDLNNGQYNVMTDQAAIRRVLNGYPNQFLKFTSETEGGAPASVTVLGANRDGTENSKNDSFAGIRLFSGNKVERTEIISDVVQFATGAVNYRGWEMRTLYGNDNRQVILQPFGNVTRSNIVANYFNGIDLVNVLETLNQMMANLGNHTGRHDIFGPIRGLGARKYAR
ncbi:gp58-like protein [Streptococcus cristatus]|uniref:Gp58-like protein n=1 Tax=Streptococcus cristatus TaxID=45634 RepID=A0A3R9LSF8_STRCR|nr:phage tail spike protein [Streptococcus cristatus]RSJ77739.1 gp58-like protein [Streptococcus cristatus]